MTTADTTPTVTGDVTLQSGENLTVEINGVVYSISTGLTMSGTNWSVTVPSDLAVGTYSVTAAITNVDGYSLSDGTINKLSILVPTPLIQC